MGRGPYARRCDQCREAKKKCDQAKPSCERCTRLALKCTGANVQRYKFVQSQFEAAQEQFALTLRRNPSPEYMVVAQSLLSIIETPGLPYDITCSGRFFSQFPQRLDSSRTLTSAVSAMVETHRSLHNRQVTRTALTHHNSAVGAVRSILETPSEAYSVQTACAIYLIMICQELLYGPVAPTTQHIRMLLMILHKANVEGWLQEFDTSMIESFLPVSTFEMSLNPDLKPDHGFYDLLTQYYGRPHNDKEIVCDSIEMVAFAQMPRFNSNPKKYHAQISSAYELLKSEPVPFQNDFNRPFTETAPLKNPINITYSDMLLLGAYTTRLAGGALLNRLLRKVDGCTIQLVAEMNFYCDEIVRASQLVFNFGPLAMGLMPQNMSVVLASSEDGASKLNLETAMLGYFNDGRGMIWVEKGRKMRRKMDDPSLWQDIDQRSYHLPARQKMIMPS
ncbi:Fungal transcriptional regulatory N-terminal [Fusarium albosuccineum]|uniref:Fungal transcriptional regulatory N-terminal n=1 Tax=Fusarium albosuccineum TaxID=1237068 RepID=A0A8H4LNI6_9HYPO|nr:Fungal transcriptional regulatory N-terminal [Fusarium albosuccineum]